MRRIVVVSGGLSDPSSTRLLADRLRDAAELELELAGAEVEVTQVDLRGLAHPITDTLLSGFAAQGLQTAIDAIADADAVIAVTPIFNASFSGLFKSFFDVLGPDALVDMPVLIAASGGTARHSLALDHAVRPMFAYLRAVVLPTAVFAASQDWGSIGSTSAGLASRIDRAAHELARQLTSYEQERPVDPYDDPTPFARLLARD